MDGLNSYSLETTGTVGVTFYTTLYITGDGGSCTGTYTEPADSYL